MQAQQERCFADMDIRDKEIQASFWSFIFLLSELSLGFRGLRDQLRASGDLTEEGEKSINDFAQNEDNLRRAYEHVEQAFYSKFMQVREAMDNPEVVTRKVQEDTAEQAKGENI
jgi:chromosome condensin MukBEF complex kleisin-like MukF subunit